MKALRVAVRPSRLFVFLLVFAAFLPSLIHAQVITGTILGSIADQSGAALPGVSVTVKNQDTGLTRSVLTDASGGYRASGLSLGAYEVRAELEGFQVVVRKGITLTVGREAVVNFKLALARVSETVVVQAEAPLVNTTESTVSHLVDEQKIRELPLNGRDFSQLILLQPGVILSRNSASSANVGRGLKISVAGARPNQNLFTLDGTDYNDALNNAPASAQGLMTGVETIKEFQVLTNSMSAEYGRASGGVFNVVTKSGTNEMHGSAFEFHRNDRYDSKNFFDQTKPDFRRNQFGASAGGPLVRDRTFFFASFEGLREDKGITSVSTVLDDNARQGILPGKVPIKVNPLVAPYLNLFPRSNGNVLGAGAAEYISVFQRGSFQNFAMGRFDQNFSERDSGFLRYLYDSSHFDELVLFPEFPNLVQNEKQVLTIEERHVFSPTVLNEARAGINRSNPREDINPLDPHSDIAFVPGKPFGQIQITGLTEIGTDRNNPRNFSQNLYQFTDNVFWGTGRNHFKSGINFEHFRYDGFSDSRSRGRLRFASIEDFLNGRTRDFELAKPGSDFERHYRQNLVGTYIQDDFQAKPRLMLNLGLRWEFVTTPKERDGKVSNLRSINDPAVTVGDPLFKNPTYKNLAPRLGFAWDATGDGRTAVRGGTGVFYEQPLFYLYRSPIFRSVPFVDRGLTSKPALPIDISKLGSGGVPDTEPMPYNLKSTYTVQYNLNVQRELPFFSTVASLGYMGSRGHNLFGQGDINTAVPEIRPDGTQFWPVGARRRNPNFGTVRSVLQGFRSEYNGLTFGLEKRRTNGLQAQLSYTYGKSMDNRSGAGGRLEFRNGQSRTFDPYNIDLDWGRSDFDVRHNLSVNASYDLPFWKGSVFGGWQVNVIGTYASGAPFSPIIPGDPDRDGSTENPGRPDLVPGCNPKIVPGGRSTNLWFNPQCFAFPTPGTRGNAKRNSLEGPSFSTVDLAFVKTTPVSAGVQLQLRVEVFNLFNRANFDIPINDPDGSAIFDDKGNRLADAGKIYSLISDGRQMQFAIRLVY